MIPRHDEEFPMRIPEMETEDVHQRANFGNDLSARHVPESSNTEQVLDTQHPSEVERVSDTEEVSSQNHSDSLQIT